MKTVAIKLGLVFGAILFGVGAFAQITATQKQKTTVLDDRRQVERTGPVAEPALVKHFTSLGIPIGRVHDDIRRNDLTFIHTFTLSEDFDRSQIEKVELKMQVRPVGAFPDTDTLGFLVFDSKGVASKEKSWVTKITEVNGQWDKWIIGKNFSRWHNFIFDLEQLGSGWLNRGSLLDEFRKTGKLSAFVSDDTAIRKFWLEITTREGKQLLLVVNPKESLHIFGSAPAPKIAPVLPSHPIRTHPPKTAVKPPVVRAKTPVASAPKQPAKPPERRLHPVLLDRKTPTMRFECSDFIQYLGDRFTHWQDPAIEELVLAAVSEVVSEQMKNGARQPDIEMPCCVCEEVGVRREAVNEAVSGKAQDSTPLQGQNAIDSLIRSERAE